jgi:hypothetical protein
MIEKNSLALIAFAALATGYGAWLYYQPKRSLPPLRQAAQYLSFGKCKLLSDKEHFLLIDCSASIVDYPDQDKRCLAALTHSAGNTVPTNCRADLSAEIAFLALENLKFPSPLYVTNDHLDVDAICAMLVFVYPKIAIAHRELVIEIARAGDFIKSTNEKAAKIWYGWEKLNFFLDSIREKLC